MKRLMALLVLVLFVSSGSANASALISPELMLQVNGANVAVSGEWIQKEEKQWAFRFSSSTDADFPVQSLTIAGNTDPFVAYTVGLVNPFSSSATFVLTLSMPYVGGAYDQMSLQHSSTINDLNRDGSASVGLNTDSHIANALLDGAVMTGLSTGCTTNVPSPQTCFSGATSTVSVASALSGNFGVRLNLVLSAGDQYEAAGRVDLVNAAVPEPATVLLVGAGLVAALRRRAPRRTRA